MNKLVGIVILVALSVLGWVVVAIILALAWVAGRLFATLLGWA
jgi:hypothetical protein